MRSMIFFHFMGTDGRNHPPVSSLCVNSYVFTRMFIFSDGLRPFLWSTITTRIRFDNVLHTPDGNIKYVDVGKIPDKFTDSVEFVFKTKN